MQPILRSTILLAGALILPAQPAVLTGSGENTFQIDMPAEPKWQSFVNGKSVGRMTVEVPGAAACRFEFDYLGLADGEEMFVYSSGGAVHGPYTGNGPINFPSFESQWLPGNRFSVEVTGTPTASWPFLTRSLTCRESSEGLAFKQRFTPSRGPGKGLSRTGVLNNSIVAYRDFEGRAVFESDILFQPGEQGKKTNGERDSITNIGASRYWPGARIPYEPPSVGFSPDEEDRINAAVAYWNGLFPGLFAKRTTEADYVIFDWYPGVCQSHVGRAGGSQRVLLDSSCGTQAIRHELGHVIGLWHEQSRQDRDTYIKVNYDRIKDGYANDFDIVPSNYGLDVGAYDYYSLMHYSRYAFTTGGTTIDPLQPLANGYILGTTSNASTGDIAGVKHLICVSALKVPTSKSIPNDVDGIVLSITVTAPNYCSWKATEGASWITLVKSSGAGGESVTFKAAPNAALYTRSANITVNGVAVKIIQAGGAI
ncbi:MAG: hypothetical protein HYX27_13235 [Acidobacteria bacterium]|nr:hypothetical protein [Acidobacteriota bacterium]